MPRCAACGAASGLALVAARFKDGLACRNGSGKPAIIFQQHPCINL